MSASVNNSNSVPNVEINIDRHEDESSYIAKGITAIVVSILIPLGFELVKGYPLTFVAHPLIVTGALILAIVGVVYLLIGLTDGESFPVVDDHVHYHSNPQSSNSNIHLHMHSQSSSYRPPVVFSSNSIGSSGLNSIPPIYNNNPPYRPSVYSATLPNQHGPMGGQFGTQHIPIVQPSVTLPSSAFASSTFTSSTNSSFNSVNNTQDKRGQMGGTFNVASQSAAGGQRGKILKDF